MAVQNVQVTDTLDALLSTTLRNYRKKLEDNIFRGLPLFYWLTKGGKKKTLDGGYQIAIPIIYGLNNTVQAYAGYDTLDVTPQEGITTAFYDWKSGAVSISISREEERKNSGAHRLINLLEAKTMQAEKSFQWWLADLLHGIHGSNATTYVGADSNSVDSVGGSAVDTAGGTGKAFNSLDHLIRMPWGFFDPATATARTHTVGKVQVSTTNGNSSGAAYADWLPSSGSLTVSAEQNTWWLNYSNPGFSRVVRDTTNSTVKLGPVLTQAEIEWAGEAAGAAWQNMVSAMRAMFNRLSDEGDSPDLILCSQDAFEGYEASLVPNERYTDTKLGDSGFQNLKFKTIPIMFDPGIKTQIPQAAPTATAPASPMYFLNSNYLEWIVDSQSDFTTTPFYRPPNQTARTAQILLMAQLVTSNRSKHGVIALANYATGYGTAGS